MKKVKKRLYPLIQRVYTTLNEFFQIIALRQIKFANGNRKRVPPPTWREFSLCVAQLKATTQRFLYSLTGYKKQ